MRDNPNWRIPLFFLLLAFSLVIYKCGNGVDGADPEPEPDFSPSASTHIRTDLDVAQELLNRTNGARVKLIWLQARLIDEDTMHYVANYRDFLFNAPASQIVAFDTDEDTGRFLDAMPSPRGVPLISRDGNRVYWSDLGAKTVYGINWDGTGKKILLQGNIFYIVCVQWDNQTNTEWLYVSTLWSYPLVQLPQCGGVYRYPLAAGMELDTARKEQVSQEAFYAPWTVSSDGKYGGGLGWPRTGVQSLPLGQYYPICDSGVNCCAQLAPDTSYLFSLFHNSHYDLTIYQFTPSGVTYIGTTWINVDGSSIWDCCCPRWTNLVHYLTGGYPYQAGWFYSYVGTPLPSDPRSIPPGTTGEFCFGKFDTTYSAINWVRVTDLDTRFRKCIGDGWVAD